ncbi:MAG TPA: hypothetical protein VMF13_15655 [Luteitalea sp.]|nr:hypothetical protein [Luteitalea sp.]
MRRPHVAVLVADTSERNALVAPFDAAARRTRATWWSTGPTGVEIELRQDAAGEWTPRQGPSFEVVPVAPPPQWRKPA